MIRNEKPAACVASQINGDHCEHRNMNTGDVGSGWGYEVMIANP